MARNATLVATLSETPTEATFDTLPRGVAWLEVRLDLTGPVDLDWLRDRFDGELLLTLRSRAEGGRGETDPLARAARIRSVADGFDRVDLESARDLIPEILDVVPPERRVVSWHGPCGPWERLRDRLDSMRSVEASLYKLVPSSDLSGEELEPLRLLHHQGRPDDVVAFASGAVGAWTRQVAPLIGAPVVYGSVGRAAAPGQPTIDWLVNDAGLPELPASGRLFGVVGRPVSHSLSPRIHNRGYRAAGVAATYVPFHVDRFADFWIDVVESGTLEEMGVPIFGLSVTTPHKEAALGVAATVSALSERLGATNTLVRRGDVWDAANTDAEGVELALQTAGLDVTGRRAVVLGAGPAGRAAAFALGRSGARVVLSNRTEATGRQAAEQLGIEFVPASELEAADFSVLVNATSLGRGADDPLPFDRDSITDGDVVVDLVYRDEPTALMAACNATGAVYIPGLEILLGQAFSQFHLMTDCDLPVASSRTALDLEVGKCG